MKLYLYDHCPFCIRVLMGVRLKGLSVELVHLDYDDEATPRRMIGRKMVPILEDADGFMGESLAILHKIDGLAGPRLFDQAPCDEITGWIAAWKATIYGLVLPRVADPVFPEFRRVQAREAFAAAKERTYGPFALLMERTNHLLGEMERGLGELRGILPDPARIGMSDILLFPMLRSLRIVESLRIDAEVQGYCRRIVRATGIAW